MLIYFKGCRRCGGDVYTGSDIYGNFLDCVQCGDMPDNIGTNSSKRNGKLISLDRHIEDLWFLNSRGHVSPSNIDHGRNAEILEKRLQDMAKYGYVHMFEEGDKTEKNGNNYGITTKGKVVVNEYKNLVRRIKKHERSNENIGTIINSYELVDEDGNLTVFGRYAIKSSTILSEFVDNIYPMAIISLESLETMQEESQEEKQPAL